MTNTLIRLTTSSIRADDRHGPLILRVRKSRSIQVAEIAPVSLGVRCHTPRCRQNATDICGSCDLKSCRLCHLAHLRFEHTS